ncbi:diguanylate cyclase [Fluoribacter dumoffii]|uniref:diguanylate cyclase n=1 Tax=Fluoribacter dumoffii TaxID=463 RepID=UPI002243F64D|nr:diguanylate cyclase [Fluoribacter dumoffii]MCW8417468.1 diguanylate cyclase [Fluoribacter dumoffii]MCW8454690.1 diguanylate cyclase [Fluoribacter dumoffii]MCW8461232.1 diguanylate cyclase [Fluoribacter dumoffii]MCW8484673.1 diguanylate cyclase [Fluoribacter dumoffii]
MDENIQKKLHDLFVHYSKHLPEKIHNIEMQWHAQLKHWDLTGFQNFHRDVHSLCGSAGTYGYIELSQTARQMEILLKENLAKGTLTENDKEKINNFFSQLKSVLTHEAPKKPLIFADETKQTDNKLVYLLEQDSHLARELGESLKQAGYHAHIIKNMSSLLDSIEKEHPIAIIIDTDFFKKPALEQFVAIQKQQKTPIHLFCIVPNNELIPRLTAIRAGCVAYFQKPLDVSYLVQELNINCSSSVNEAYRILILDDSKSLAEYYSLILKQADMITRTITNPLDLLKELESFQPDLLLMDVYMPECSGLELAALLRKDRRYTKIPIIFLSTEDDKNKKLTAISLGGDDFLTKPISPNDLVSAVRSRSNRASILNYYMTTDSLTGLLNHSSILNRLNIEVARAKQQESPLSFIMIDIDHFKLINDTYGHPFGDLVIKKLASLFMLSLRNRDIIGRYGGEEFALILPGADLQSSAKICNDLRLQFAQNYFTVNEQKVHVTISVGISAYKGNNDINSIVIQADQALYKAKENGRNQVVVFDDSLIVN